MQQPAGQEHEAPASTEAPPQTPVQRVAGGAFSGIMLLALYGMTFSPFVPNHLGLLVALAAAAFTAGACAWLGQTATSSPRWAALEKRAPWMRNKPLRIVLFAGFGFLMTLLGVGGGLESIWTSFLGAPGQQSEVVSGWSASGRRSCAHFDIRGLAIVGAHGLCADRRYAPEAVPGRALILKGRVSPLGVNVEGFELGALAD